MDFTINPNDKPRADIFGSHVFVDVVDEESMSLLPPFPLPIPCLLHFLLLSASSRVEYFCKRANGFHDKSE
jgi:hypothetical protein